MSMTIKQAAQLAVDAVQQLFDSQSIYNVMFEEVDKDAAGNWLITVGFDRKIEKRSIGLGSTVLQNNQIERKYKVAKVDGNGEVVSVKDRLL